MTDNLGDVIINIGSGAPHRLLVDTHRRARFRSQRDHAGRLPARAKASTRSLPPIFNELYAAQPVRIETAAASGSTAWSPACQCIFKARAPIRPKAGRHREYVRGYRRQLPQPKFAKQAWTFSTQSSSTRRLMILGYDKLAGASIGDRFGAAALLESAQPNRSRKNQRHAHHRIRSPAAHRRARPTAHSHPATSRRNDLRRQTAPRRSNPANGNAASRPAARTRRRRPDRRATNRRRADRISSRTQAASRRQ